jgi:hypothetical protein
MARPRVADADGLAAVQACATPINPDQGLPAETGAPDPRDVRHQQRVAVRYTLQILTDRAPGHSVEVRIPPFAAVQAIPGPVHRRGTPSAVIEMDPATWLALATGELSWARAKAAGRIRASGERADLSPWLPLVTVRPSQG